MTAAKKSNVIERPPVVAVLGHVDHGKSTLLDYIRQANTVAKEAGGITQHVAAYEATHKDKQITFIDTPGHAAFSAIRARGANVADICILVVAADDGVKAQTLEALASIRAAKTPFVVAINKIDKPNADLSRTQASLLEQEVFLEQFGGDVPWAAISAKTGQGVAELLDLILLVAEVQELRGDTELSAIGYVIEANRDKKRGIAATLIIKNGTLSRGEFVLAGTGISPVRIMEDSLGRTMEKASFSSPVTLIGFDELPSAGSDFSTFESKRRAEDERNAFRSTMARQTPTAVSDESPDVFHLPVIIRADTTGSLDAIQLETAKIGDAGRKIRIVQCGIGAITEDDIKNAQASLVKSGVPSPVFGFHVGIEPVAKSVALERGVSIEQFDIIYKLTERMGELLKENAPKRTVETVVGSAKVLKYFSSKHDEHVIGARVIGGELRKKGKVRVMRRDALYEKTEIINLQSNKQNVDKVTDEGEFGAVISGENSPMPGDILECFETSVE